MTEELIEESARHSRALRTAYELLVRRNVETAFRKNGLSDLDHRVDAVTREVLQILEQK